MSDDNLKIDLDLDVKASGVEVVEALNRALKSIEARVRAITAGMRSASGLAPSGSAGSKTLDPVKTARDSLGIDRDRLRVLRMRMGMETRERLEADKAAQRQARESERAYRLRMAWNTRLFRQQEQEERRVERARASSQARQARAAEQANRRQISFTTRMFAQRAREETAAERDRQRADRQRIRLDNYKFRLREREERRTEREQAGNWRDARTNGRASIQHGHDAYARIARPVAGGAAVVGGAGALAARNGISARMAVDTAETNMRIFSGLSQEKIRQARRNWLDKESIRNGIGIAGGLEAYNETLKAGIKSPEAVTKTIMSAVTALELDLKETTRLTGLIDRNFGAASTPAKLKSALNAVAITAKEDPTQANEIVEGTKRAFGVLSMSKITPEKLVAMVSGGQSVGIQPGKAGTFLGALFGSVSEGDSKFLDPKKRKEMNFAAHGLGYGNARDMAQAMRADGAGFYLDLMKKLSALPAQMRTQIAQALGGHQWADEIVQQSGGVAGLESTMKAVDDPANSNFLDEAAKKRRESWLGQWNSTKSVVNRFWEAFGSGFDEILTAVNSFFLDAGNKFNFDQISDIVKQGLAGVKDALGIATWRDLIQGTFGGNLASVGQQVREFARGFADGVLSVGRVVKGFVSGLTGTGASAETLGQITGKIVALAAACIIAAPVVTVIAGIASVIMTLATASVAAWSLMKASGLVGAAGAGGALGKLAGRAGAVGVAGAIGANRGEISTYILKQVLPQWWQDALGWEKDEKGSTKAPAWIDPPAQKALDGLKGAVEENTLIHRQSLEQNQGLGSLIHKTALTGAISTTGSTIKSQADALSSALRSGSVGSFGGGGSGFAREPLSSSIPGSALGPSGLSRRGIIGGGGFNPGGAEASSAPGRGLANHMHGQYGAPGSGLTTITTASGRKVTVHTAAAGNFRGFLNELEGSGYKINSLGGYNHRSIRGSNRLSQHAYGNAIDINPAQNPMGPRLITDMPKNISDMAAKWGITWGGDWKRRPDAMHFEWNGRTLDQLRRGGSAGAGITLSGAGSTAGGLTGVIERAAAAAGVDPRIMHGIRAGESGHRADYDRNITAREESYGPFQLNRKGGLGQIFERETGLDLKNPVTIQAQAQWVANHIRKRIAANPSYNPRSEWYGFKGLMQSDPRWGNSGLVEAAQKAAEKPKTIADEFTSTGWRKVEPGDTIATRTPLGQGTPVRPANTIPLGGGGRAGSASTSSVHAPITINGAGQDPEAIANKVQRALQESMNRRTHDLSPNVV